jgi:tRNA nucleotidyltransferase (CCA-adding enzyme)
VDSVSKHGEVVLERLREVPGARQLLDLAAGRDDVELVGGATRDLLLGLTPRELDVVVAGDAASFAGELAGALGLPDDRSRRSGPTTVHERFGTALVCWQAGRIDVASRRAESYPAPGALPVVRAGTPEQDLRRRDFTVNALAVPLGGARRGELRGVPHALEDLDAARLRVLHERSFRDDPTRLLRLARYRARLGFEPERLTAELAAAALQGGALETVSGARIGAELRLALAEPDAIAALAALGDLGVLSALHPPLGLDEALARSAVAMLPRDDGRADLLLLACLTLGGTRTPKDAGADMLGLLDEMEFAAADRDRAWATAQRVSGLVELLPAARTASELREATHGVTLEAVAIAGAALVGRQAPAGADAARRWLSELRHVRLRINGDDLLAAGIPAGPEIGRRLEQALRRKLNGELADGREAELSAAMEGS